MTNQNILTCEHLSISRNKKIVLQDINFSISTGEIIVLLGANGSGKSTLLKAIGKLLPFQAGNITLLGEELRSIKRKKLSQIISYTAQNNDFDLAISVYDFVSLGRYPHQGMIPLFSPIDKKIIDNALEITNLSSLAEKQIAKLSGGEQQRALLARALATEAPLMLLDEPSSSLDIKHQLEFFKILKTLRDQGKTIIIAIHDINDAIAIGDKIILLHQGNIIFNGIASDSKFKESLEKTYQIKAIQKDKFDFELK
jgi:iron complex transport system ATP-binding protein